MGALRSGEGFGGRCNRRRGAWPIRNFAFGYPAHRFLDRDMRDGGSLADLASAIQPALFALIEGLQIHLRNLLQSWLRIVG
jgi:hypothetical protein